MYNADYTSYNILIEKGENATQFEPAHVLQTTIVTQNKPHTLTAKWQKNN